MNLRYICFTIVLLLVTGCKESSGVPKLTQDEKNWLQQNLDSIEIVADPNYAPIEFINYQGEYDGASSEYLKLFEKRLHVKFKRKFFNNWGEIMDQVKLGNIDVLLEVQKTEERSNYLFFTEPLFNIQNVLLTRKSDERFQDIKDLSDHKVAMVNGYAIEEYILQNYPSITPDMVPDISTGLKKLVLGECDALIADIVTAVFYIEKENIPDIKIIEGLNFEYNLRIGVTKKYPELYKIIVKTMNSITAEEKEEIKTKWFKSDPYFLFVASRDIRWILGILAGIVLIIVIVLVWNKILHKKVKEKTKELISLNELLESRVEERTKDLLNAVSIKDKFLSLIAHDLKNPFLTMKGLITILREEWKTLPEEEINEYVDNLNQSIDKSSRLTLQLLEWARTQNNSILIEKKEIILNNYVIETIDLLKPMAINKSIDIVFESSKEFRVLADSNSVLTIIRNLLNNAIKFSHKNSSIKVGIVNANSETIVAVSDSGTGIAPERQNSIFRLEKVMSNPGTDNESGSGLGLQICKELVEKNGGKIWFESELHNGTTFYFSVPSVIH